MNRNTMQAEHHFYRPNSLADVLSTAWKHCVNLFSDTERTLVLNAVVTQIPLTILVVETAGMKCVATPFNHGRNSPTYTIQRR